jgi:hypothetical protein
MGTVLEDTPTLTGHLTIIVLAIVVPCCSISHNKGTSHSKKINSMQLDATVDMDLAFMGVMEMS